MARYKEARQPTAYGIRIKNTRHLLNYYYIAFETKVSKMPSQVHPCPKCGLEISSTQQCPMCTVSLHKEQSPDVLTDMLQKGNK